MIYLENDRIRLRAPEPEDLDVLYRWENDTTLWESGATLTPYSRYNIRQYIAESGADLYERRQLRLMVELRDTAETVGTIDIYDFDPHHLRAAVGILIDAAHRRCGIAAATLKLFENYAFGFLRLHRLEAYIPAANETSLRLFERCGYANEGVMRDRLATDNGFDDIVFMAKING